MAKKFKFKPSWSTTEFFVPLLCTCFVWVSTAASLLYFETTESFFFAGVISTCASCAVLSALTHKNTAKERDIKVRHLFRRTSETYSRLKKALKREPNTKKTGTATATTSRGFAAAPVGELPGLVIEAVRRGDAKTIERWVGANNVDSRELESGSTLLHFAALEDQSRVARLLLKASANPNITDADGNSPLHIAAAQGSAIIVKYLCEYGANPYELNEKKDGSKRISPMDLAEDFDNRGCVLIMERAVRVQGKKESHAGSGGTGTPRMRNLASPLASSRV